MGGQLSKAVFLVIQRLEKKTLGKSFDSILSFEQSPAPAAQVDVVISFVGKSVRHGVQEQGESATLLEGFVVHGGDAGASVVAVVGVLVSAGNSGAKQFSGVEFPGEIAPVDIDFREAVDVRLGFLHPFPDAMHLLGVFGCDSVGVGHH